LEVRLSISKVSGFIQEFDCLIKVLGDSHTFLAEHSRPVLSNQTSLFCGKSVVLCGNLLILLVLLDLRVGKLSECVGSSCTLTFFAYLFKVSSDLINVWRAVESDVMVSLEFKSEQVTIL